MDGEALRKTGLVLLVSFGAGAGIPSRLFSFGRVGRAPFCSFRTCIHSRRILDRRGILYPIKANFCRRAVARQENLTWSGGKRPAWTAFCGCEYRFLICDPPNRTGPGCFQPGPVRLTAPAFFTAATPLPPTTGCATTQAYKTCLYGNGCKR